MRKSASLWLMVGCLAYCTLPWYLAGSSSAPEAVWPYNAGLVLALDGHSWLLPLILPLIAGLVLLLRPDQGLGTERHLWWMGATGLLWIVLEGAAIDHRGWSAGMLAMTHGSPGPKQGGMGYGALLTALAFLMMTTHGLAARGWCRGDAFTVSAIGLVIATIALFTFYPIAKVLTGAFHNKAGEFAPADFAVNFFDRSIWGLDCLTSGVQCGVAWNTVFLAVLVGIGTTLLGLAFALLATRTQFRAKGVMRALTLLPIITPPFVIGLAIILLFGRSGSITALMYEWFDIPRSRWIYGLPGIFLAQMLAFTPIAYLVLLGVVQGISPSLEEASQTLRAGRWGTFSTISLPLMRPGIANAFLIGFIESMADFGNPLVLGGSFDVLSTKIYFAVVGAAHDPSKAAVFSIVLLMFTLAAFYAQQRWLGRRSFTTVTGKGDSGLHVPLPRRVSWLCYAVAVPWLILTLVVYVTIFVGGFVKVMGRDYTPTLEHFLTGFAITSADWGWHFSGSAWDSFFTTVQISAIAAPLTAFMGLLTAYLLTRQSFAGQRGFEFAALLSFAIPGTVVGVSYIMAFNVPPIEITGTAVILVICFIFRNMPVGMRSGIAVLSQIDKSLDEASTTLGAHSATTLRKVILPLIRPAIVAAMVYAFVRAMTAVSAIIFLVSAQHNMATAYIVGRVEAGEFGLAIAYSCVLIAVMLVVILLMQFFIGERRLGRRTSGDVALQAAG